MDIGAGMALAHVTGGASKVVTAGIQLARLGKPKSRPQLPAGPSTPNPAVRSMQDGKQLPTGRRPLELPPGPSSSAGSTPTGPSGRRGAGSNIGEQAPRPTATKAGPPPERRASRNSWMSKSQVPTRLQEMQQQRRPVRRPQGPRGR